MPSLIEQLFQFSDAPLPGNVLTQPYDITAASIRNDAKTAEAARAARALQEQQRAIDDQSVLAALSQLVPQQQVPLPDSVRSGLERAIAGVPTPSIRRLPPVEAAQQAAPPGPRSASTNPLLGFVDSLQQAKGLPTNIVSPGVSAPTANPLQVFTDELLGGYQAERAGAPQASGLDTLLGLGAALYGGGGFDDYIHRAGDIHRYQQMEAENFAKQARLAENGSYIKKSRDSFIKTRMLKDVNAFSKYVLEHPELTPEQRMEGWDKIRASYAQYGQDIGPSPDMAVFEGEESTEQSNAKLVENFQTNYGEHESSLVKSALAAGATPLDIMKYDLELKTLSTAQRKEQEKKAKDQQKIYLDRIKEDRERDLARFENLGITGEQFTQTGRSGDVSYSQSYGEGLDRINRYHDARAQAVLAGGSLTGGQLIGSSTITEAEFPEYINELGIRTRPTAGVQRGLRTTAPVDEAHLVVLPLTTQASEVVNLPSEVKQRAIIVEEGTPEFQDVINTAKRLDRAILVKMGTKLRLIKPKVE